MYYVTSVADDMPYLRRLLDTLAADDSCTVRGLLNTLAANDNVTICSLVVVVMDDNFKSILDLVRPHKDIEVLLMDAGPPFSRSIGMKMGFQRAGAIAKSRGQDDAVIFSIDTSIITPRDFSRRVRQNTICGVTAYIPIVYKCISCAEGEQHDFSDGHWVNAGYGMLGLCFSDYTQIGGWSTVWGHQ